MKAGEHRARHGDRRSLITDPVLLGVLGAAVLALVVALVIGGVRDVPLTDVVEDPAATTGASPLTGALSNLGVLVWWVGAVTALFSTVVFRRMGGDPTVARFLLVGGVLAAYMAIDDLFLIHDELVVGTPLPQPAFLGLLVLAFAWYLFAFRRTVATTEWPLLGLAGVLFGASLGIDFVSDLGKYLDTWETAPGVVFAEDALKWLGIVAWTTYLVRASASALAMTSQRHGGEQPTRQPSGCS